MTAQADADTTLALTPLTFPIKPMSAEELVKLCSEFSAQMDSGAEVRPSSIPVGFFGRSLAIEAVDWLSRMFATSNDDQTGLSFILHAAKSAEFGFWTRLPPEVPSDLLLEIHSADCIAEGGKGWPEQPWTIKKCPPFLHVKGAEYTDPEEILPYVYATLHR